MAEEMSDLECQATSQNPEVEIIAQRFAKPVSEDFVQRIAESSIPTGTRRKMNWAEKVWTTWLSSRSKDDIPEVHRKALRRYLKSITCLCSGYCNVSFWKLGMRKESTTHLILYTAFVRLSKR